MELILADNMTTARNFSLTEAVKTYGHKLLRFIRGKVRTDEDAEDILQDVWFQLSKINDLDALQNLGGWLYRVARNRVVDMGRKKTTAAIEDFTYEDEDGSWNIRDILLMDTSNNPELAMFREAFWEELMQALADLPENQRRVFELNELEGLTLREIAENEGENIKTIISRKGYAVKYLRSRLYDMYKDLIN